MAARETLTDVFFALQRVFVNVSTNLMLSAVLDRLTPAFGKQRNEWLQMFEGIISVTAQTLLTYGLVEAVMPFYDTNPFETQSHILLGPWFMFRSMRKINNVALKLYDIEFPVPAPGGDGDDTDTDDEDQADVDIVL